MGKIAEMSAVELARRIGEGDLLAADVLEACKQRIREREPVLRAFSAFDEEATGRQLETLRPGRLHGVPVAVKDVLDVAGMASGYGSPIWEGHVPRADSTAVALLRREGALIIGKTVTTEFAVRHPGPTVNPHNPKHTPGGSSSGSAAGLAAHLFPLALGTQTAGSIIRPSAYCGVVGYKPSFGWVPRSGMKLMAESLDTIGPMGRTVADVALLASVLTGRDFGDVDARPGRPLRIGICRSFYWDEAEPAMRNRFEDIVQNLDKVAVLKDWEWPAGFEPINDLHTAVQYRESALSLAWELEFEGGRLSPWLRQQLQAAWEQPVALYDEAFLRLEALRAAFDVAMQQQEFDLLLTLAAAGEAPAGLESTGDARFNRAWSALQVPCVNVPAGVGPRGLPLGIQLVGRRYDDASLLRAAAWLQHYLN